MSVNRPDALNDILIISNVKDHTKHFIEILDPEKYSVLIIGEEIEILQLVNNHLPSLIIIDTNMSGIDSFELFQHFKANLATKEIPVIFIVSNDDQPTRLKVYASGESEIITTPLCKEEILMKVDNNLKFHQLQKRNEQLERELITIKESEVQLNKSGITFKKPIHDHIEIGLDGFFNIEDLQKLQSQFANAFGVASIITDPQGMPITQPSNFGDLCQYIIRKTDKALEINNQSETKIGHNYSSSQSIMHSLSGGLFDAGAKITVEGKHFANWLLGQIISESTEFATIK